MTSPVRAPRSTPRPTARTDAAPRRRFTVVEAPARRERSTTGPVVVFASVVVFGSLLAATLFHGMLAGGQVHLDELDQQIRDERIALAQAQVELADLQTPDRIAREAEALGMVQADELHWLSPGSDAPPVTTGVGPTDADADADSTDPDGGTDPDGTGTGADVDDAPVDQEIGTTSELAGTDGAEGEA